ncbi:unnamed protein product [Orchesella dallaii]|uniref:Uncharacterized protein n=1 Tax=Orchesella dallaii TaxID=48710 RepID=A0ABP1QJV5_9HEXA
MDTKNQEGTSAAMKQPSGLKFPSDDDRKNGVAAAPPVERSQEIEVITISSDSQNEDTNHPSRIVPKKEDIIVGARSEKVQDEEHEDDDKGSWIFDFDEYEKKFLKFDEGKRDQIEKVTEVQESDQEMPSTSRSTLNNQLSLAPKVAIGGKKKDDVAKVGQTVKPNVLTIDLTSDAEEPNEDDDDDDKGSWVFDFDEFERATLEREARKRKTCEAEQDELHPPKVPSIREHLSHDNLEVSRRKFLLWILER